MTTKKITKKKTTKLFTNEDVELLLLLLKEELQANNGDFSQMRGVLSLIEKIENY